MKNSAVYVWVLVLLAAGCVNTKYISEDSALNYYGLNEVLAGKQASVNLMDGQELAVEDIQLAADSASWFDVASSSKVNIATSDIASIEINDKKMGASLGIGYGILSGAIIGGIIGLVSGDEEDTYREETELCGWFLGPCSDNPPGHIHSGRTAEEKGALWGLGFGLVGGVIGRTIGSSKGFTYRFELNQAALDKSRDKSRLVKDKVAMARQPHFN